MQFEAAPRMPHQPASRLGDLTAFGLCLAVLFSSFALVSFDLRNSVSTLEAVDTAFHHMENDAAERQKSVTKTSVFGYLLLGAGGLVALWAGSQRQLSWNAVTTALGLYYAWAYASFLWSDDPTLTLRKLVVLTLFSLGALGFVRLLSVRQFAYLCAAMAGLTVLVGVMAEARLGLFRPWQSGYRFSGVIDPNEQATYCGVIVLVAVLLLWPQAKTRPLAIVALLFAVTVILLTKSRTAAGACLLAASAAVFLRSPGKSKAVLFGGVATTVGLVMTYIAGFTSGFADLIGAASLGRAEHIGTLTGRVPLWQLLMNDVRERVWLGHGYGAFWNAYHIDQISSELYWHVPQAHSVYVDALLNLGVVGLVAYLAVAVLGIAAAASNFRRTGDAAHLFVASMIVFMLIHGIAESKFFNTGFPAFVLLGCVGSLVFNHQASQIRRQAPASLQRRSALLYPA